MVNTKDPLFQVHVYLRESHIKKLEIIKEAIHKNTKIKLSNSEAIRLIIDYFYQIYEEKEAEKSKNKNSDEESTNKENQEA